MYAFGSVIDWLMKASSGLPAACAYCASLSRSGPTLPVAPAAVSVWHEPHGLFLKIAAPDTDGLPDPVAFTWLCSHLANAACVITIACVRITAWPRPQSSVQITGYVPTLFGVMWSDVSSPGTVSSFCPNSGTQNEWMTSFDERCSSTERFTGSRSVPVVNLPLSGYSKLQANCWAVTLMFRTFLPCASSRASTIALKMPIAVTSTVGISVQTISRFVWPWIGGPSESSSGAARKCRTE
jgi:hypothetical protein